MRDSLLIEKSINFSTRMVKLYNHLRKSHLEYLMSKQLFRSGTSIGANIHEAYFGQSKKDFISKLGIALKECGESQYWIKLLGRVNIITEAEYQSLIADCQELGKMLTSSIRTAKQNNKEYCAEDFIEYGINEI